MPTADVPCQKCKWNQWQLSSSASIDCDDERLAKASEGKGRQKMQLQTRMASHKKTTVGASARSHHSVGVYLVLGLTVMAHLEKSLGIFSTRSTHWWMEPGCKLNRKEKGPHHYKVMTAVLLSGRTPQPRQILSLLCIEISNSAPLGMLRGFCHAQHLRNTHATRVLRDHATLYFTVLCARGM